MSPSTDRPGPVLLFDGTCGLCNRMVRGLLRMDRRARLRFAPLQSSRAQIYLKESGLPTDNFETLVYVPDWSRQSERAHRLRTAGVIAALRQVGGLGPSMAWILSLVPESWRDAAYRMVGHMRYRMFGQWHSRPLPCPQWEERFIDPLE